MRESIAVMLVLVFLVASCLAIAKPAFSSAVVIEDSWASKTPMHVTRSSLGVAVVNGKIYAIGGLTSIWPSGFISPAEPTITTYATNEVYTPVGYGTPDPFYVLATTPPEMPLLSPLNQTYYNSSVSLVFTVDKPVNWMGYSLDGKDNVTITGNTTITGLSAGLHNITVYAKDEFENIGVSETISFSVAEEPEPFPTALVATASGTALAVVGVVLLVYLKKRNR